VHTFSPATFFDIVPAFWWLGLLAQWYLVFPLVLRLMARLGAAWGVLLLSGVGWGSWMLLHLLAAPYPGSLVALVEYLYVFNLPARLPEFAVGMWFAASWPLGAVCPGRADSLPPESPSRLGRFQALTLAALLVLLGGWALPTGNSPLHHIFLVACCVVAFMAVLLWTPAARMGRRRVVVSLAAASYSIYLLHQPILGYASDWLGEGLGPLAKFGLLAGMGGMASIFGAMALDRLVGRWERRTPLGEVARDPNHGP
jgi:peptidoglycan/LPS O-acetylase OafA/YrhL